MKGPVVIVGGGTAGCTVASYLAEHTTHDIVVCEPGHISHRDDDSRFFDGLTADATSYEKVVLTSGGNEMEYAQARVVGGGSAINGMIISGEVPQHLASDIRRATDADIGVMGRALLQQGGRHSGLWWNNRRWNPATDFAQAVKANRVVWKQSSVTEILHKDGEVCGVRCGDTVLETSCVVMAAGALRTPVLLLNSGCQQYSPRIGEGLQDHPSITFAVKLHQPSHTTFDVAVVKDVSLAMGQRGLVLAYERAGADNPSMGLVSSMLLSPESEGTVRWSHGRADVHFNMLSTARDVNALTELVQLAAAMVMSEPFRHISSDIWADSVGTRVSDVLSFSDDQMSHWLHTALSPVSHASGSMRYAVDSAGRVVGMTGLRVMDASVLPGVPPETTAAPVVLESLRLARALGEELS